MLRPFASQLRRTVLLALCAVAAQGGATAAPGKAAAESIGGWSLDGHWASLRGTGTGIGLQQLNANQSLRSLARRAASTVRKLNATQVAPAGVPSFTNKGESGQLAESDVIRGDLEMWVNISVDYVGDVFKPLKDGIVNITGCRAVVYGGNGVFVTDQVLWNQVLTFSYLLLIPPGSTADGLQSLRGFLSNRDGRFEDALMPRLQLAAPRKLDGTRVYDTTDWYLPPQNATWIEIATVWEPAAPLAPLTITSTTTRTTTSTTPRPAGPTPQVSSTTRVTGSDRCLSSLRPCDCTIWGDRCIWADGRCRQRAAWEEVGISCADCSLQAKCPNQCSSVREPCACASLEVSECRWDEVTLTCEPRGGNGVTTCTACARQTGCNPPTIIGLAPNAGAILGLPQAVNINITFDRDVQPCTSQGVATSDRVVALSCDTKAMPIALAGSALHFQNSSLSITLAENVDTFTSSCSLVVGNHVVCGGDGVPSMGLAAGEYSFILGERVAPAIVSFTPTRRQDNVPVPVMVTFNFSERIALAALEENPRARLSLVDDAGGLSRVADILMVPPQVKVVAGTQLVVDLSFYLELGLGYSLAIPNRSVHDLSGNDFAGLLPGAFTFKTSHTRPGASEAAGSGSNGPLVAGIVCAVLIVLVGIAVAVYCVRRRRLSDNPNVKSRSGRSRRKGASRVISDWLGWWKTSSRVLPYGHEANPEEGLPRLEDGQGGARTAIRRSTTSFGTQWRRPDLSKSKSEGNIAEQAPQGLQRTLVRRSTRELSRSMTRSDIGELPGGSPRAGSKLSVPDRKPSIESRETSLPTEGESRTSSELSVPEVSRSFSKSSTMDSRRISTSRELAQPEGAPRSLSKSSTTDLRRLSTASNLALQEPSQPEGAARAPHRGNTLELPRALTLADFQESSPAPGGPAPAASRRPLRASTRRGGLREPSGQAAPQNPAPGGPHRVSMSQRADVAQALARRSMVRAQTQSVPPTGFRARAPTPLV